jgi:MFS family permease
MKTKTKGTVISLLSTLGFFGIFSTTISKNPVLPLFIKSMHAGTEVIGTIAAISPLAGILFSFPIGLIADRLGKKRLLIVSAFVFLLAPIFYLLVADPWWLIPVRFFHGIATAILGPVSSAIILGEYHENKGKMLGIYSSATLVGRTLAPILGGAIISVFAALAGGWNYRLVYVAAFILSIPVFILSFLMPDDRSTASGVRRITLEDFGSSLLVFVRNRKLLGTALVEMATYFTYGAFETYLPLYLQGKGLLPYQIGFIFSLQVLAIALTKPFFGHLSDRIDRRVQILVGIIALGGSFALIPVASGIIVATAIGIVFGMGLSFSTVATSTYVSDVAAKENLGSSMGALSSIMDIGQSAGPFVIGSVIQISTMTTGFLVDFAVCLACAALFAILGFSRSRQSNPAT